MSLLPRVDADAPTGRLNLSQRWRLALAMVATGVARKTARQPRAASQAAPFDSPRLWQAIEPPRGALAARAWKLAHAHQPAWLLNHGLRTHAWAQALGVVGDLRPDTERLFAASMLHDAGLTPVAAQPSGHCFAVRGARYAHRALASSASAEATAVVAHAIARHLDLRVDVNDGVEAHLLQAGAAMDVLGRGLARLPPDLREKVLQDHPRLQMKTQLCRCMQAEATAGPSTRIGVYVRRFGFLQLIEKAPFVE